MAMYWILGGLVAVCALGVLALLKIDEWWHRSAEREAKEAVGKQITANEQRLIREAWEHAQRQVVRHAMNRTPSLN